MDRTLSKAEQNALMVSYDVMGSHVELDLNFVKQYLVRGKSELVSDQEIVFFMNLCQNQRLNPLVGSEVYLIKYTESDPAQTVVGKGAYMRRLYEHPEYLCKEDGITVLRNNTIVQKEGCCLYPGESLVGGWCRIHYTRNGTERSAFKEVALSEYNKNMANWKSKPATMINKVAVSQCAREAFPKDYDGVYSEEEMIASGAIPVETDPQIIKADPADCSVEGVDDPEISKAQRQEMFRFAREKLGNDANNILKNLVEQEGYDSTEHILTSAYMRIMDKIDIIASETGEQSEDADENSIDSAEDDTGD